MRHNIQICPKSSKSEYSTQLQHSTLDIEYSLLSEPSSRIFALPHSQFPVPHSPFSVISVFPAPSFPANQTPHPVSLSAGVPAPAPGAGAISLSPVPPSRALPLEHNQYTDSTP